MFSALLQNTRVLLQHLDGYFPTFSFCTRTLVSNSARGPSQHVNPPPSGLISELLDDESEDVQAGRRTRRTASECSVLLFPGQGSQFVGMGQGLLKYGSVREMFRVSHKVLGYDLLSLCLNGPKEDLDKTIHCQPAVFVTSLAAVERLNHEMPQAVENCVAVAGFSVGEYAALVFAGSMDFTEGRMLSYQLPAMLLVNTAAFQQKSVVPRWLLHLLFGVCHVVPAALYAVKVRAEAMQEASDRVPSGMLSVVGRPKANYNYACLQAREHCLSVGIKNPVCAVASYLFPDGRVIAGHQEALDFLQKNSRQLYFQRVRQLPVSGAFHTPLMQPAVEPLRQVLSQVTVRRPQVAVHANVDGKRYAHEGQVRRLLAQQLVAPVCWEQTLHAVYERAQGQDFPCTYEVGPGRQLGSMLQKVNLKAFRSYAHVNVVAPQD
ncbi:malonyl-CoA-acyl carrier protein transacylase, mitochondrial isoform X1 [Scleropages formosus]|uniref:Malonyl CoA:ACP acyltransferase (mitochondrial) n=1 Tax=Scleropages formosus TaxID=113540 RepID=A0A8C9VUV1_SCLFO|nr:malonyl-CoA-acyl carrier protein transacylase, mitochondrial isoform X1 [Scleropages formosus]